MFYSTRHLLVLPALIVVVFILMSDKSEAQVDWANLKAQEIHTQIWTPEAAPARKSNFVLPAIVQDMRPFYAEFLAKKTVTIFIGLGMQAYESSSYSETTRLLKAAAYQLGLKLSEWQQSEGHIGFYDSQGIHYEITFGHERNEYAEAFNHYDVIMYHGHSRYGRGPAFDSFSNYFRLGDIFKVIEVEAKNPYFVAEPIQLKEQYPVLNIDISGRKYDYQYQGQKVHSSYLPAASYVKNIAGLDIDFKNTEFKSTRQIIYLYSCSNIDYFRNTIRARFPDSSQKIVFGTKVPGYWSYTPEVAFITSLVQQVNSSDTIVRNLNATRDCGSDCFVAY